MKVIIYAMGRIFDRFREKIAWDQVVAIADRDPKGVKEVNEIPVIFPKEIISVEYDCIAIFSDTWFEEIKSELVGMHYVSPERVISWRDIMIERENDDAKILQFCQAYIKEHGYTKILDLGMSILPDYYLTKPEFLPGEDSTLDGMIGPSGKRNACLYDHIYETGKVFSYSVYDAILAWDIEQLTDAFWTYFKKRAKCVLVCTPYLLGGRLHRKRTEDSLRQYGAVECLAVPEGLFWRIDFSPQRSAVDLEEMAIFVVTHKDYNLCHNSLYRPICVGGYQKDGFLTEQDGENIAYLNPRINECTALYWIWKNTSGQYVGLNHYRRYFYKDHIISRDNYLDQERIYDILKKYDMILPEAGHVGNMSVLEQIYSTIDRDLCDRGYRILREEIIQKQPEYLNAFEDVLNGHNAFLCNMFVTRYDILNQYCEWLFSFLIDAATKLEVDFYDSYSQRLMGFFAERMMTIWLRRQHLKIKELPYTIVK